MRLVKRQKQQQQQQKIDRNDVDHMISAWRSFWSNNDNNNNIIDRTDGTYDRMITWTNQLSEEAFVEITTTII